MSANVPTAQLQPKEKICSVRRLPRSSSYVKRLRDSQRGRCRLEPTASNCKERKSKPTQAKDFAENELGEDLLMKSLRDELRARAVPFFEGARNPLQTASRNAPQAVAQGAPYKPCSWCWKPALLDADCPHCPHCCCDPFSAGPGALPRDYGVEWEDAEVPGLLAKHWKWFERFIVSLSLNITNKNDEICDFAAIVSKLSEMFGATTSQQACPVPPV